MNRDAIILEGVAKAFSRATGRKLLRSHIGGWFGRIPHEPFYALKNVSFRIGHSESVAIVGSNGAGKSTLLSVVAGLAEPDAGTVTINGRVAALLELGSGFHPDLTGVENVYLNASLLGLGHKKTESLFDEIVEFAGIGDFIQEPLRTYSSGMVMRLAFSVAVNVDPDILILDEVTAVGDQAFQMKCRDKIAEFRAAGKTMLSVSHATTTLQDLCSRAIWLDHGQVVMDGPIDDVIAEYQGAGRRSART